jgi:serine/threonine-protein kinase/endoribonuclease IRE1
MHVTAGGSSGWQAPEQLIAKDGGSVRQTRAMDVFSLGCILHFCLTGGLHPFGENYQRDANIRKGRFNMGMLQRQPEAANLVATMLAKQPALRPSMVGVLCHPMWWDEEQRLQFLVDISDR